MRAARLALASLALAASNAWAATTLQVIVFPGGFNWPLWVGQEKGFFDENGLELKITGTPGSIFQVQNLMAGKFDIAFSNYDNVVAYMEGQGEAPLPQPPDLFTFMGVQYGAVRLVANPEIKAIAELKGKSLAVDAATTGYAFVLMKMLQQAGLNESDYTLDKVGSTSQRAEALMQNKTAATILTTPLEILPESRGYRRLANATDAVGPYQAVSGVARRSWAKEHRAELVGFIMIPARPRLDLASRQSRGGGRDLLQADSGGERSLGDEGLGSAGAKRRGIPEARQARPCRNGDRAQVA